MKPSSLFSLLISVSLFFLLFWGFTKFIVWYPTFNNILFYLLAFFFAWSIRFVHSKIRAIKAGSEMMKLAGFSTIGKINVAVRFISLAACWVYLTQAITHNYQLYPGWTIVGLISFLFFVAVSTLTLIAGIIVPID